MRHRSQAQLVELLQYMEELSLLMDEMQYNKYILQDLTPEEKNYLSELAGGGTDDVDTTLTITASEDSNSDKENDNRVSMEQRVAQVIKTQASHDQDEEQSYKQHVASELAQKDAQQEQPAWTASFHDDQPTQAPTPTSRIDLLLEEPKTSIPKLKKPPATLPRSIRAQSMVSPLPSAYADPYDPSKPPQKPTPSASKNPLGENLGVRSKIEERWDEARIRRELEDEWNHSRRRLVDTYDRDDEGSLMIANSSSKRLLQHFKGCVKCLL